MNARYPEVALRAGHRCEYCHAPEVVSNFPFEVEHVVPESRGGTDDADNAALSCRSCNLRKSAHLTGVDPQTGSEVQLFHPRAQRWDEHFRVDDVSDRIEGTTPVGRATVSRLQMNSESQVVARRQWIRLGLFP